MNGPRPSRPVPSRSSEDGSGVAVGIPVISKAPAANAPSQGSGLPFKKSQPGLIERAGLIHQSPSSAGFVVVTPNQYRSPANSVTLDVEVAVSSIIPAVAGIPLQDSSTVPGESLPESAYRKSVNPLGVPTGVPRFP